MTDLLPAMFLLLLFFKTIISASLSQSFSLLPFALTMQLIKLREEVSASLLKQLQSCFPN